LLGFVPKSLVFDFDGTITFNSDFLKKQNIKKAALMSGVEQSDACRFADFFFQNSGLGREVKIQSHFPPEKAKEIITNYNRLNRDMWRDLEFVDGFAEFAELMKELNETELYILSGGKQSEICAFLEAQNILPYFTKIFSDDMTKAEHFEKNKFLRENALFFCDSKYDVTTANLFDVPCIVVLSEVSRNINKNDNSCVIKYIKDFRQLLTEIHSA